LLSTFTDIGTAWTELVLSRKNGFNTSIMGGRTLPFQATVTDFRNPFFLVGWHWARTTLLGCTKYDLGWGLGKIKLFNFLCYLGL
jgi:hypothetical protein